MEKKILGLDLGVSSIGWALIKEENNKPTEIIDLGCRIIPLSTDDKDEFSKGVSISKNQKRTLKRTQRRGYDRYQLRRKQLIEFLESNEMRPDETLMQLPALELYGLREKALNEKISRKEIGRILYHLNQKRGYKSSRSDASAEKKDTEYVAEVKSRYTHIKELGLTIGQSFYRALKENQYYRLKQQVFPREAYIEEFEKILIAQQAFHSDLINDSFISELKDEIIYYQRPLKSQKGLVSICEFEGQYRMNENKQEIFTGPKVAPRSSPLFQVCKIWEIINTITIKNKNGETLNISNEKKKEIFDHLDNNKILTQQELFRILGLKKDAGWYTNKQIAKGIQGNLTKTAITEIIGKEKDCLQFNLTTKLTDEEVFLIDKKTGEIIGENKKNIIHKDFRSEKFYQLWHIIYSIPENDECIKNLLKYFPELTKSEAEKLAKLDFKRQGFGNKSAKAIRKILPYLSEGYVYSDACSYAGYNHSASYTNEEIYKRQLKKTLPLIKKNTLRQPVVEKILNHAINLVNALIEKYDKPDEIRIELARELKQSKDERNETFSNINATEALHEEISKRIKELGINPTKKIIEKYKFIFPIKSKKLKEATVCNQCKYCGQSFNLTEALTGDNFDVDHIIPKSLLFDDSQSNKVLVHRKCNADEKKNKTAFDYIRSKGEVELNAYLERIDNWYRSGILSYTKVEKLKTSYEDYLERKRKKKITAADKKIWEDFIARQLRETQYISRKAKEIFEQVCYNVWSTSGQITDHLKNIWGWDEVLMNLNLDKYRKAGLTEYKEVILPDGAIHNKEIIKGWTKRDDHRHHAIDALTIACTKQGFIQRINTLNASDTRNAMLHEIEDARIVFDKRKNLLENYIYALKPFKTGEIEAKVAEILISFKPGKKTASFGKRKIKVNGKKQVVQSGIIVPRGALSEESVYGRIKIIDTNKPVKYLFENPHLIVKNYIRQLVEERLQKFANNTTAALKSLKNEPIFLDKEQPIRLEYGSCYKEEYVIKYPLENLKIKDVNSIIDEKVRDIIEQRLKESGNKEKEAFKNTVWFNEKLRIPIRTVRCFTGLNAVEPVKQDENGRNIGFIKPGNNHHIAFYKDENGKLQEHSCTFWHAVERKKYKMPAIITNPKEIWDTILHNSLDLPDSFLEKLPKDNWIYFESLQQNEMFVLGLNDDELKNIIQNKNKALISNYLYLTWAIAEGDYWFRHHLETKNTELKKIQGAKETKRIYRCSSSSFFQLNPCKIKIDNLGDIII